ncbi:unnamed protein product [Rotaria socialis]|uniref:Uncharacterized protein n=2 Tax=Rotaria socialis TaxID=392032 RepID=A0A818D5Q1_9BILA|nr:unnamed protein product [Rotaria socialis]
MVRSLTELELDRFMENILLRDKLNNELVEMRNERRYPFPIPIIVSPNALKFISSDDIQKWIPILVTPNALKSLSSGDIQKWIPILVAPNALKFLSSEDT